MIARRAARRPVSALRVVSEGMRNPDSVMPFAKSKVTDLWPHLEADHVAGDRWREVQPDSELLELNGDRSRVALDNWNREFAAGEKTCFLAVVGNQVWLGQALKMAGLFEGSNDGANVVFGVEKEQIQEIAEYQLVVFESPARRTAE